MGFFHYNQYMIDSDKHKSSKYKCKILKYYFNNNKTN